VVRLLSQMKRVPTLDAEDDMKISEKSVRKLGSKVESIEKLLGGHTVGSAHDLLLRLATMQRKKELEAQVQAAKREVKAARSLILKDDLKARQRVLRRLNYVNSEGVVTVKGQVAAGIQSGDELVMCEMIFNGAFNDMSAEQLVAAASCFVWQEKGLSNPKLPEELVGPFGAVREAARRVAKVSAECKVPLEVEEYVEGFRPDLMESTAAWLRGARFADVLKMHGKVQMFEGSLVRAIRRLDELLRQVAEALHHVGETVLEDKFVTAGERIRRDVIFAASLYL